MPDWPDDTYCDICGWGDTVRNQGFPDDPHHFCHRHKADEVLAYMDGHVPSYNEMYGRCDLTYLEEIHTLQKMTQELLEDAR